ncbi:transcription antitermination protein NusB [Mycoplasma buteonis]|uniref:transcription antitermination protein NusB n=1 Tax=Mycoplasma buteonis TaxID=171280 RepID=UPI00055FDAB5|nr:transcription antitermination protein NusB [Mycoplasma buteonis]
MHNKTRREKRVEIIQVIYKYELLNQKIVLQEVFDEFHYLDKEQLIAIDKIAKNYDFLKKTISKFINKNWEWNRISPIIRAILLNGGSELFTLQPKIVINEAIEITKMYFLKPENSANKESKAYDDWQYKFVNGVLENYYKMLLKLEIFSAKSEYSPTEEE